MLFAGFERPPPVVGLLRDALARSGVSVSAAESPLRQTRLSASAYDSDAAELRAAGAWARSVLEAEPAARIAIVRPGLESEVERAAHLVREGLVPGWQYGGDRYRQQLNVSLGRRLSSYPAVEIALLLLRWFAEGLTSPELATLLRTPLLAAGATGPRSRLELELRKHADQSWTPARFREVFATTTKASDCAEFFDAVDAAEKRLSAMPDAVGPSQWAACIDGVLADWHWCRVESPDSEAFQLVNRWRQLLNDFARVAAVTPTMRYASAVARLARFAGEAVYQPESVHAGVELLGPLETAGLEFDFAWWSGLDARRWPPPSRRTPFVARELRIEAGMPDATPVDTLQYARQLLESGVRRSQQAMLSYARHSEDGELAPSPLVAELGPEETSPPRDPGWPAATFRGVAQFERNVEDAPPPVAAGEKLSGGAYALQAQHREPFDGFVTARLHVRRLHRFQRGVPARQRGIILHDALHNLVASGTRSDDLLDWSAAERQRRIGSAVDQALAAPLRSAHAVQQRLLRIERARLFLLLDGFLEKEAGRDAFVVDAVEHRLDYRHGDVSLELRVDRIDRYADGGIAIIDYKSGQAKRFVSRDGDLTDVQLVAYADAADSPVAGLAMINLDTRQISYSGRGPVFFDKDADDWPATFRRWQRDVHALLDALAAGDVRIDIRPGAGSGRVLAILSRREEVLRER